MLSIGSGGESLGTELLEWGKNTFNVTINEVQILLPIFLASSFPYLPIFLSFMAKRKPIYWLVIARLCIQLKLGQWAKLFQVEK